MGCSGNNQNTRGKIEPPKPLTIHGSYLDTQTRALLTCLEYSGVPCHFESVMPSKNENMQPKYLRVNPTGDIPTLEEG